jgi:hypothetical protein
MNPRIQKKKEFTEKMLLNRITVKLSNINGKYKVRDRRNISGKVLSAILLVGTLFFGGSIVIAIANSLSQDNPLHFWLPPVFMFSFFIAFLIYLSRGKREEGQENFNKTQLDKYKKPSQDLSMNLTTTESVEPNQDGQSENVVEKVISKYLIVALLGCVLLFGVLASSIFIAGGTAVWGKIEAGRFFLGEGGEYTEVTSLGYILSAILTFSLGILFPFAAYALCSMYWKTEDPKKPSKRFGIFFVVFASFIGIFLAIKSFDCFVSAVATAMRN